MPQDHPNDETSPGGSSQSKQSPTDPIDGTRPESTARGVCNNSGVTPGLAVWVHGQTERTGTVGDTTSTVAERSSSDEDFARELMERAKAEGVSLWASPRIVEGSR